MYAQRYGVSPSEGEGAAPQETPAANLTPSYAPTPEGGTLESTPSFSESNLKNAPTPAPQPDGVEPPNISRKEIRKSYQAQVVKIFFKDMLIVIVAAMVLTLVLKTFVFQPFGVPSSSMENTLKPDDRILVSKVSLLRGIQRGDVVVFRDTKGWLRGEPTPKNPDSGPFGAVLKFIGFAPEDDDEFLVKRVIGIPGDTVSCKGGNAPLLVNGQEISNEPFLKPGAAHSSFSFDVTVPEGQLWVMGDNRPVSADSRLNTDKPGRGFVDEKDVVGIVFMRVWPQSRFGFLDDERKVFADVPKDAPSGDSE
jgi:signal peptidase I